MRMLVLIATVIAAALLIAPASPQEGQRDQKIKELQKERIAVLKEMADQVSDLFKNGQASPEEAAEALLLVLNAELDAAEKQSDRVTLNKKVVDVMKKYEEIANAQTKTGQRTQASLLKVRARRLNAEIDLERAKLKEAKESK